MALLVIAIVLAACGGDDGASERPAPSSTTTTAPPPTAPEPPVIGSRSGRLDALPDTEAVAPVALHIPSLGIAAPVRAVGVEPDGEMEVPAASDVGWYRFGPAPGADGSTLLAAHVDYEGERGVFFELRRLRPGARVEVTLTDGSRHAYAVVAVATVPKADLPGSGVFDRTGPPRLALITCGGAFDAAARSYRDNVVAYAEPVADVSGAVS
jgi:sortase (surface protein transpeptidase)